MKSILVVRRVYVCAFCDFRTPYPTSIQNHLKRHCGEGHYKCRLCSYRSNSKSHVRRHQHRHHQMAPSDVRLKINYNCTRRAPWYSKLGYQRTAEPFLIGLATINSDGGAIGMVKIHIIRVYPLRYMERQAGKTVWRNKKAEDKRAQEWANARMREMDTIHQKVQEDYEKEMNSTQRNALGKIDCNQISEISSPKLLYQICWKIQMIQRVLRI